MESSMDYYYNIFFIAHDSSMVLCYMLTCFSRTWNDLCLGGSDPISFVSSKKKEGDDKEE
jgi:hypothetical protein